MRKNLALLGPTSEADAVAVYAEFGRVLADYFYAGARSVQTAIDLVDERLGFEHLKAAREAGRGALLLTPHLSFFELGSAVMHEFGYLHGGADQPGAVTRADPVARRVSGPVGRRDG